MAEIEEYRHYLIEAERKSQEDFDKLVIYLSGGALGLSAIFIEKLIPDPAIKSEWLLMWSWISWIASLTIVLFSYYSSIIAIRKAIDLVDGKTNQQSSRPGGFWSILVETSNILGAVLFVLGVILMMSFLFQKAGG